MLHLYGDTKTVFHRCLVFLFSRSESTGLGGEKLRESRILARMVEELSQDTCGPY